MTTVITRAYADEKSAMGIRERLYRQGFPRHQMSLISARENEGTHAIEERMRRALVPEDAARVYAQRVVEGASLVVVRATYKPLNAVRLANETFESSGAMDVGIYEQQFKVPTPKDHAPSVLKDHPRFFTMPPRGDHVGGPLSDQLGFRLLSAQGVRDSVIHGGKIFMGDGIIRNRKANSVFPGGGHMSRLFWPMPLLSKRKRGLSVTRNGGHPFSRLLGWPTIS